MTIIANVPSPSEYHECRAFYDWAKFQARIGKFLVHIANERKCSVNQHLRLKLIGVQAGFPDYFLAIPSEPYHGLFIEMKRKDSTKSRVSPLQTDWINSLNEKGYLAVVTCGSDEAIAIVKNYLGMN